MHRLDGESVYLFLLMCHWKIQRAFRINYHTQIIH